MAAIVQRLVAECLPLGWSNVHHSMRGTVLVPRILWAMGRD